LASRSANKGGMAYSACLAISDKYIGMSETIKMHSDFTRLLNSMFLEYAKKTALCRNLDTDSMLIVKINKDVQMHIYEKINVSDISERLKMSSSYLCRHFREKTGITITEFIQMQKIEECKRFLRNGELTIAQIAESLGFSSQSYLHAVFKKHVGMTLVEYRNANMED
jgi:AraC-like DNA-binding protein